MALGDLLSKTSADVRRLKTAGDIQEVAALEKSIQLALLNVEQVLADLEDSLLDLKDPKLVASQESLIKAQNDLFLKIQAEYRSNVIHARKEIQLKAQKDRAELGLSVRKNRNTQSTDESLIRQSDEITKGLKQAVEMLNTEVERSVESVKELDASTKTMRKTKSEYMKVSDLLVSAGNIIKQLNNRDSKDRAILYTGLCIFLATIVYIIARRFYVPGLAWASQLLAHPFNGS